MYKICGRLCRYFVEICGYLGSWIAKNKNVINMRIGKALDGLDSVNKLWKLISFEQLKPSSSLSFDNMDSTYSITLQAALNIPWHQHITNKEFWYNRLRFVRHCLHSKQELVAELLYLLKPKLVNLYGRCRLHLAIQASTMQKQVF